MNNPIGKSYDVLRDGISYVKFINMMPNDLFNPNVADLAIVQAARVSYADSLKGDEKDKKLLFYLMRNEHTSPFEMVEYVFEVCAPLPLAAQWMRHRTASYNQVSRRYTDEDIEFYVPPMMRMQDDNNKQASTYTAINLFADKYKQVYELAFNTYKELIAKGVAKEQARMVLPNGLYTKFIVKTDLHNLLNFIRLRADKSAQWEMQMYAACIYQEFIKPTVAWTAEAFEEFKFRNKILHKNYVVNNMIKHDDHYMLEFAGKYHSGNTVDQLFESLDDRYILVDYVENE